MSKDAMDLLMGAGVPSASFDGTPPIIHKGRVLAMEKAQQRDINGNKKFWDDGEPMWQLVFTIDTGVTDPSIDNDDGVRKIYAKAQMLTAIREAVKRSGHRGDLVGGTLAVRYKEDGEVTKRGYNPPKIYDAKFTPPTEADLLDDVADPVESNPEPVYSDDEVEPF